MHLNAKQVPIFARQIVQKDNTTFCIDWADGKSIDYRLNELQKNCPCARCRDEKTGRSLIDPRQLCSDVRARRVLSVGRYALRIEFTSGCSRGIYTFSFLQQLHSRGA